jgi:MEDS: MEthanogen/methylotroph, DcmR Sensory domain
MEADAHTLAVDQMQLGDHAFAHHADNDTRWELPTVFAGHGLALGHKVVILADPAVEHDDACQRVAGYGGAAEQALVTGQLSFTSMRELIHPDRRFSMARQLDRLREEIERARRQGYGGLRVFVDMAWVQDLDADVEGVMRRETGAGALFARRDYAEVCSYDTRLFTPEVIAAMRAGHPVVLLERPGDLQAYSSANGWHLIGDADVATRRAFRAMLRSALDAASGGCALVDLSRLCFLSAGCASDLLRLAGESGCERVVVHCATVQARTLRRLGADRIPGLVLDETADAR